MSAIQAIHVGLRQLGIEEDDARDIYERVTKKRSLRAMNYKEQKAVVGELRKLGFSKSSNTTRKRLQGKYAPKLQALWIALYNIGAVNKRDDEALLAFVKRQTGVDHTRFLHHAEDAKKAIEALKSWLGREGVDWTVGETTPTWSRVNGYRIATAQWWKLHKDLGESAFQGCSAFVRKHTGKDYVGITRDAHWIPVMNALGREIRSAK